MPPKIINDEQYEFWNEGIGKKWVQEDASMNERFTTLTNKFFSRAKIDKDDSILDIGCGGGITSYEASKLVGENGYVIGADISEILLDLAKTNYPNIKNLEFKFQSLCMNLYDAIIPSSDHWTSFSGGLSDNIKRRTASAP